MTNETKFNFQKIDYFLTGNTTTNIEVPDFQRGVV